MLIAQNENQRILIHDTKKHLQSIALLNEDNENEKIRAKTGEQKMFSPEMAVKMLKRKKKWAKETWTKELSPIIY